MAKTGVRKNVSVRQKFRKNVSGNPRVKTVGKRSVEGVVVKVDSTTLVQPVAQAIEGSESNPTSENGICFSRLRAKMAGTLRAHGDQNSTDVFDKEMLKNLLREVSLKVNSPSGETSQNVLSGVNSKRTTQKYKRSRTADDGKSRKRKAHNLDLDPEQSKAKTKMRKMESDEAGGGSSGVDVNKLKRLLRKVTQHHAEPNSKTEEPLKLKSRNGKGSSTSLRERMVERLNAARFRYINEQLYSVTGFDAQAFFSKERDAFDLYHQGYKNQVQKWPINPIDVIIQDILTRPTSLEIADFGCGDAKLATSVPNTVHSFDLIALNDHVVECDISKVPLNNESVDVVVCCLSLMGTNLADYLKEANRVLKLGGELKVAEIESRINNVKTFIRALKTIGFTLIKQDTSHKMFVFLDLIKKKTCPPNKRINIVLQPCLYKKR